MSGAAVGEHRARAASQHGRHPLPLLADSSVAERVDAPKDRDQKPSLITTLNRPFPDPELE